MTDKLKVGSKTYKIDAPKIEGDGKYGHVLATKTNGVPVEIRIDDELVTLIMDKVRKTGGAEKRWDINRIEGEAAEGTLAALINDSAIEVKRDFKSAETGNIAVEFMCANKPSGISTTQADWWAYFLDGDGYDSEVIVLMKRARLLRLIEHCRIVRGGDRNASEMFLLPVSRLLSKLRGKS
jgi:hypothetical protein